MRTESLTIGGAFLFESRQFPDHRGKFAVWYEDEIFRAALGHSLPVAKTHHAVSKKGTIRGIHFTSLPPGQRKYVYCSTGAILDVIVDLRIGSPTFGQYEMILLDNHNLRAIYVPEGVGHGYAALDESSTVVYMCTTPYSPGSEVEIDPFDDELSIPWPKFDQYVLSDRDKKAPSLKQSEESLPTFEQCREFEATL